MKVKFVLEVGAVPTETCMNSQQLQRGVRNEAKRMLQKFLKAGWFFWDWEDPTSLSDKPCKPCGFKQEKSQCLL